MIVVSHNNPIAPSTAPSADEIINALQANHAAVRGETQQAVTGDSGYNPYKPVEDNQQDAQQAHTSNMEQFLAPIAHNQYDIDSSHTPEKMKAFHDNIMNDPAFKEIGDDMVNTLEELRQGIISGSVDPQQAREIFSNWGQERFEPVFEKHHGSHSPSHKVSLHDTSWIKEA